MTSFSNSELISLPLNALGRKTRLACAQNGKWTLRRKAFWDFCDISLEQCYLPEP